MMRAAWAIVLMGLAPASPATAMPNAFWIFGFHVPGKHGPKSDVVMERPIDQQVSTLLPAKTIENETNPIPVARPRAADLPDAKPGATS